MTKAMTTIAVAEALSPPPPDPEVAAKARRRSFTTAYKLAILDELDCGFRFIRPGIPIPIRPPIPIRFRPPVPM
jgi:hypothetical protein